MPKKSRFRGPYGKQHGKRAQALLKSASHHIIFIDHWRRISVGNSLSYRHAKFWDSLLTHWLPMKSILFFIGTI